MALQTNSFPSYTTVVYCVKMIEMKEMEVHASQERTKKSKTEGGFNSQSSGATSKGSKPPSHRGESRGTLGSMGQLPMSSQGARSNQRSQAFIS